MHCKVFLLVTVVLAVYLVAGGFLFRHLEKPKHDPDAPPDVVFKHQIPAKMASLLQHEEFSALLSGFAGKFVSARKWNLTIRVEAAENATGNETIELTAEIRKIPPSSWDYYEAIFYAQTLVTTIGYGRTSPVTLLGRQISLLYSIIGVPILFLWATSVGEAILSGTYKFRNRTAKTKKQRKRVVIITLCVCTFVGSIVFLLLPSYLWHRMEGWTYADSFYYSFIGLSTIGLGDLVAANEHDAPDWYRFVHNIWMMCGMPWIAMIIGLLVKVFRSHAKATAHHTSRAILSGGNRISTMFFKNFASNNAKNSNSVANPSSVEGKSRTGLAILNRDGLRSENNSIDDQPLEEVKTAPVTVKFTLT